MTIYIEYFKAEPFLVDRNSYIEKYTTRNYNQYGCIGKTMYNAPHCLICIEGSYIEDYNLLQVVPSYRKVVVNKFLMELKYPASSNRTQIRFKWKR